MATPIKIIENNKIKNCCRANCTLYDKLLSKSSWSLVVLANILPVGVISNHDKGVFKST